MFFFFQAEDGIRDWSVTGVQTCALPIKKSDKGAVLITPFKICHCMLLTLYFIVVEWFRNVKDIKDADITTPVHANRLWDCLEGNPNRDFIVSGFRRGFRIGICRSPNVPVNNINIGRLKTKNRKAVIDKLNVELSQGRILGPFSYPPLDYATYSP